MGNKKLTKIVYLALMGMFLFLTPQIFAQFTLSGTVTDSSSTPIFGVKVLLFDEFGTPIGIPLTQTDGTGFYSIVGLPVGVFGLEVVPAVQGHIGETYLSINVNGNTTFDVMLATGFHLSGFVRDSLGQGIFDIDLNVYEQNSGNKLTTSGDNTDITGFYHITVPPGEFIIRYRAVGVGADPWVPVEIYNVVIGSDTTIDINMEIGFEVFGTITEMGGAPAVNADLDFFNRATGLIQVTPSDNTDGAGFFSVILPSGIFDVNVSPQAGSSSIPLDDTAVVITGVTTLNYTLDQGFYISGIVTNSMFTPIQNVDIDIIDSNTGIKLVTSGDNTDASGFYQVIVPSGTYNLVYQPLVATGLAPAEFPTVLVTNNYNQDVTLVDGILISGIILNGSGEAVFNADIDIKDAATGQKIQIVGDNSDEAGTFTVVIEPGIYNVEIEPLLTNFLSASLISNISLNVDTLLNITLDTGLVLSGTVTDAGTMPVANVEITVVITSTGDTVYTQFNNTDLLGQYEIYIPNGNYNIFYNSDTLSTYIDSTKVLGYAMTTNAILDVSFGSNLPACCIAIRGNVDGDLGDAVDISDLVFLVDFIFTGGASPSCDTEANVDGDVGEQIDISDLVFLVDFIFTGGGSPVVCP